MQTTDWNDQTKAEQWRAAWADTANRYLEKCGHTDRLDHRSYERQGIDQVPTIHLGVAASQMERKGIRTGRGDINRKIEVTNQKLRQLKERINKLTVWLKEEAENPAPPTLADVIENILSRRSGGVSNLKSAANMLNFLTSNNIQDMAGLDEKFSSMIGEQLAIGNKLKPVERQLKVLDEHLRQSENFKSGRGYKSQYEKLYSQYETLKKPSGFGAGRKMQKALDAANEYYEAHQQQITLYESAERYLRDVFQGSFAPTKLPPMTKWKEERARLIADKQSLTRDYHVLKSEVSEAEKIRRYVYDIMGAERCKEQPRRARDMER